MEVTTCIKSTISASNQFKFNNSDDNLLHLLRQLDVLISITSKTSCLAFFQTKHQLLSMECFSSLLSILNEPNTKSSLALKALNLLNNLANSAIICEILTSSFDTITILVNYFLDSVSIILDQNSILCLQLLEKLTYKTQLNCQTSKLEEIIKFLLEQIESKENEMTQCYLGLLANLIRSNNNVRVYIKHRENTKLIYKRVMSFLGHKNQKMAIFSISILCNLCLQDDVGRKIFNGYNMNQTFQLLLNILTNARQDKTYKYATDLFIEIIKNERFQALLMNFENLFRCLQIIIRNQICGNDLENCSMTLDLLLAFCSIPSLQTQLATYIFDPQHSKDIESIKNLNLHRTTSPFAALLLSAQTPIQSHDQLSIFALDFLYQMYMVHFSGTKVFELENLRLDLIVGITMEIVISLCCGSTVVSSASAAEKMKYNDVRNLKAIKLLKLFSNEDIKKLHLLTHRDMNIPNLLDGMLRIYRVDAYCMNMQESDIQSITQLQLVLEITSLYLQIHIEDKIYIKSILEDERLIPFVGHGLLSNQREIINLAIDIFAQISRNLTTPPITHLSEVLTSLNYKRFSLSSMNSPREVITSLGTNVSRDIEIVAGSVTSWPSTNKSSVASENSDLEASITNIIDKFQNGTDLKDVRASEIIGIYEHRLQTLQAKENHLQDLLDTKTLSLHQSDRLISQFRTRITQQETEGHRLRMLLHESEKTKEEYLEKYRYISTRFDQIQNEHEVLQQDNLRLQDISSKYYHLVQEHAELTQKLESCQRSLSTVTTDYQTQVEMGEMAKRRYETLRQQYETATKKLTETEEERSNLVIQLKDKESKNYDLQRNISKLEEGLKKKCKEADDLETAVDQLRAELGKAELANKELTHQVTSLEVVCRQRESTLREKESNIIQLKTELDKHAQIAALIHNLSSGNLPNKLN